MRHLLICMDGGPCMQVGFLEVVVLPMFQSMVAVVPGAQLMLNAVADNYLMWRTESQQSR